MIVRDLIPDAKEVLGQCNQQLLFSRLTDAINLLADKGNWNLLVGWVDICTCLDGKTITLPREIDTPLALNVQGQPRFFRNQWHEFHMNGGGSNSESPWSWDDRGDIVTFMDILGYGPLIAVAELKTDLAAKIRVFGYDRQGNIIRTQEPDGRWLEGYVPPINIASDFPFGIITPDPSRLFRRIFSTTKVTQLDSTGPHQFVTGAAGTLGLINAPMPSPLINGTVYFIRVIDENTVSIHSTRQGALTNTGLIVITSVNPASIVSLTDRRVIKVQTQFNSATPHIQRDGMALQFTGAPLPSPLVAGTDYYSHVLDDNNFTAHESLDDAIANVNPIDVSTPGTGVSVRARQDIDPITHLDFSTNHNFLNGDSVQVRNASGTLPDPLLPGTTYYVHYVTARRVTIHTNLQDANTGANPIVLLSSGSGPSSLVKTMAASALTGSSNNIQATGHNLTIQPTFSAITTASRERTSNVATLTFSTPHGLASGDVVAITAMGDSSYNTTKSTVTAVNTTQITYQSIGANEVNTPDVTGQVTKQPTNGDFVQFASSGTFPAPVTQDTVYRAEPPMSADTFTLYDTSASPVDILASGSGQLFLLISRIFTVGFTSDWKTNATKIVNGTPVKMSATGSLPPTTPSIDNVTTYFARKLTDDSISLFDTLAHSTDTAVRVSSTRARASNVATVVTSAAHGLITGDFVDVSGLDSVRNGVLATAAIVLGGAGYTEAEIGTITDGAGHTAKGQLTVSGGAVTFVRITQGGTGFSVAGALTIVGDTSGGVGATATVSTVNNGVQNQDSTYNGDRKQITFVNATTFTYSSVGLNEPTTADINGAISRSDIKVLGVGNGDVSLVFERTITAIPASSLLRMDSSSYLQEGATVRFETDGTLPAPLLPATDYHLSIVSGLLQVKDTLDNNITLTNIGSGAHSMVIARNFTIAIPTSEVVVSNNYNDGDVVQLETSGTLPFPLLANTNYYLRRISDDAVEIYDTQAHAIDFPNTTGRIVPTNTGIGIHQMVQNLPNIELQKITRVDKSITSGNIKLYCWDYGRNNAMTMIGNYAPDETEPRYRRIKIDSCCKWVRLKYQRAFFQIRSEDDFVPLRSKMAIVLMLKACELFRTEFIDKAREFEADAVRLLSDNQASNEGPVVASVQFNEDIFTDPGAQGMDDGRGLF